MQKTSKINKERKYKKNWVDFKRRQILIGWILNADGFDSIPV